MRVLLEKYQFEVLEISTPGKLDIDILCNNRSSIKDKFWQTFIDQASSVQLSQMQKVLADNGFSSHMMTVCRKT